MITPFLISLSFANPTHGFEMEFFPQSNWNQYILEESLDHPLSINHLKWIPWGTATFDSWAVQYTVLPRFIQNTNRTTDTTEQQIFGHATLGINVERLWSTENVQWSFGVGTIGNIPLWSIQSSQYTATEQEDIDAQSSVRRSEIRQFGIRLPFTTSFHIQENIQLGLGVVPIWLMNWGYTEYVVEWTHQLDVSPQISIHFIPSKN